MFLYIHIYIYQFTTNKTLIYERCFVIKTKNIKKMKYFITFTVILLNLLILIKCSVIKRDQVYVKILNIKTDSYLTAKESDKVRLENLWSKTRRDLLKTDQTAYIWRLGQLKDNGCFIIESNLTNITDKYLESNSNGDLKLNKRSIGNDFQKWKFKWKLNSYNIINKGTKTYLQSDMNNNVKTSNENGYQDWLIEYL